MGATASVGQKCARYCDDLSIGVDLGKTCECGVICPWVANRRNNSAGW